MNLIIKKRLFPCAWNEPIVNYRHYSNEFLRDAQFITAIWTRSWYFVSPDSRDLRSKTISEISANASSLLSLFVRIISIIRAWPMSLFFKVIRVERAKATRQDDSHVGFAESRSDRSGRAAASETNYRFRWVGEAIFWGTRDSTIVSSPDCLSSSPVLHRESPALRVARVTRERMRVRWAQVPDNLSSREFPSCEFDRRYSAEVKVKFASRQSAISDDLPAITISHGISRFTNGAEQFRSLGFSVFPPLFRESSVAWRIQFISHYMDKYTEWQSENEII